MTTDDQTRKEQTVVRVCAKDHPTVTYYVRRDQPEPPCPACTVLASDAPAARTR